MTFLLVALLVFFLAVVAVLAFFLWLFLRSNSDGYPRRKGGE